MCSLFLLSPYSCSLSPIYKQPSFFTPSHHAFSLRTTLSTPPFFLLHSTLADMKLHLQTTDYGNFLQNETSPLAVTVIDERLKEKLVSEFMHIRKQCVEPLATFLDFITWVNKEWTFYVHC